MFLTMGMIVNTLGIFLKPMVEDLGSNREAVSLALIMGGGCMAFLSPVAGKIIDKIGVRPVMSVGTLIAGLGLFIVSRITQVWQIYATFCLIWSGLAFASLIPCSLIISNWFVARRGLAMGLMAMGTSLGAMVMSPVLNWIILNYGWRSGFIVSGTLVLAVGGPMILLVLRTHPSEKGLESYGGPDLNKEIEEDADENGWGLTMKEARSTRVYWHLAAMMFIFGIATTGLVLHCVPYLTDLGHSPTNAAFAWSIVMGSMAAGKFALGPIADRWTAKNAMTGACILATASLVLLILAKSYVAVVLFALVYGFAMGAPLTIYPLLTGRCFGTKNFGEIYGKLTLISFMGSGISFVSLGAVYERLESYLPAFYVFVFLALFAIILSALINPQTREKEAPVVQNA
jgi:MFS family permease